jgi:ribosomal protein L24E
VDTKPDILPDSRARVLRGVVHSHGIQYEPIFCGNCAAQGGYVVVGKHNFAFWLCSKCEEKHGEVAGLMKIPDEVFWAKVNDAMKEEHGRVLTPLEQVEQLLDDHSPLAKLARDNARNKER